MTSPFREKKSSNVVLWIIAAGVCVFAAPLVCCSGVFILGSLAPSPRAAPAASSLVPAGQVARLQKAFLAVDEESNRELNRLCREKNTKGVMQLMLSGKAFAVEDGTQATVLEPGVMTYRVRIVDGPCAGKSGLIATEFVGH